MANEVPLSPLSFHRRRTHWPHLWSGEVHEGDGGGGGRGAEDVVHYPLTQEWPSVCFHLTNLPLSSEKQ